MIGCEKVTINEELFQSILPLDSDRTKACVKKLGLEGIIKLQDLFSACHWQMLEKEQVLEMIGCEKVTINEELFQSILPLDSDRTKACVKKLGLEGIIKLQDLFSDYHWQMLEKEQVIEMIGCEKVTINEKLFQSILPLDSDRTKACVKKLGLEGIIKLQDLFSDYHWQMLEKEQVLEMIGCEKVTINEKLFQSILPLDSDRTKACVKKLGLEGIIKLQDLFSDYHWQMLEKEQVLEMIGCEKVTINEKLFQSILPLDSDRTKACVKKLGLEGIIKLQDLFFGSSLADA